MVMAHVGDSAIHDYQNGSSDGTRTGTMAASYDGQQPGLSIAPLSLPAMANALIGASDETAGYMMTYEPRYGGQTQVLNNGHRGQLGGWSWTTMFGDSSRRAMSTAWTSIG